MIDDALLTYRPFWRPRTSRPGAHAGSDAGSLGLFRNHLPFSRCPEARRIDLRATLRDPFGEIHVRRFAPHRAVDVYAVVDISASMNFVGLGSRLQLVEEACRAIARSAHRYGDAFGLIGADDHLREDIHIRATRRNVETEIKTMFAALGRASGGAAGLADAAALLGGRRKLVFLLSDFRYALERVEKILASLSQHDVIPVILCDTAEEADLPRWGLLELQDLETGRRRLQVMRPSLRRKWLEAEATRRSALNRIFLQLGRGLVVLSDRFDVESFSRQLAGA